MNRTDYGHEEAAAIQGADPRAFNTRTKRFLGDVNGHVREVHTIEVEWIKGADGSVRPDDVRGTDRILAADLVVLALGFSGPERALLQQLGLRNDERGNVRTDDNYMTNVPGVFSAGDMVRGPSLVVWAIRQGQAAAQAVDLAPNASPRRTKSGFTRRCRCGDHRTLDVGRFGWCRKRCR